MKLVTLYILLTSLGIGASSGEEISESKTLTGVIPTHYTLVFNLKLNSKSNSFKGIAIISLNVTSPTTELKMICTDLKISRSKTKLKQLMLSNMTKTNSQLLIGKQTYNKQKGIFRIIFDYNLQPGNYKLRVEYFGILNEKTSGLHLKSLVNSTQSARYFIETAEGENHACSLFPCWADSKWKTTFSVRIIGPSDYRVVFNNMKFKLSKFSTKEGKLLTVFKTTYPMFTNNVNFKLFDIRSHDTRVSRISRVQVNNRKSQRKTHFGIVILAGTTFTIRVQASKNIIGLEFYCFSEFSGETGIQRHFEGNISFEETITANFNCVPLISNSVGVEVKVILLVLVPGWSTLPLLDYRYITSETLKNEENKFYNRISTYGFIEHNCNQMLVSSNDIEGARSTNKSIFSLLQNSIKLFKSYNKMKGVSHHGRQCFFIRTEK